MHFHVSDFELNVYFLHIVISIQGCSTESYIAWTFLYDNTHRGRPRFRVMYWFRTQLPEQQWHGAWWLGYQFANMLNEAKNKCNSVLLLSSTHVVQFLTLYIVVVKLKCHPVFHQYFGNYNSNCENKNVCEICIL